MITETAYRCEGMRLGKIRSIIILFLFTKQEPWVHLSGVSERSLENLAKWFYPPELMMGLLDSLNYSY